MAVGAPALTPQEAIIYLMVMTSASDGAINDAELRAIGALSRGRVRMQQDEKLARALTRSSTKIESAVEIAHPEYDALGARLRLVILTPPVSTASGPVRSCAA